MDEDIVVNEGQEEPVTPSPASQAEPSEETPSPEGASSEEMVSEPETEPEGGESEGPSDEEKRSLSERTQKRIRTLIQERNKALDERKSAERRVKELEGLVTSGGQTMPLPQTETARKALERDPKLAEAVERLKEMGGFVTQKDLQAYQDRLYLEQTHERMKVKYPGDEDMPAYDPVEIEDHMRRTGNYNPEAAYKDLYDKERIQKAKKEALKQAQAPYSETPGKPAVKGKESRKGVITRDSIAQMSDEEYEANRDRILKLQSEGKL